MKREFQVIYRQCRSDGSLGPLESVSVIGEKQTEAEAVVTSQKDLALVCVRPGLALIDWGKPILDRLELAEAFSRSVDFVEREQAKGKFPRSPSGHAFFSRRVPIQFVEEGKAA